jgi:solute carrier family 31 (copper transporter), member 1
MTLELLRRCVKEFDRYIIRSRGPGLDVAPPIVLAPIPGGAQGNSSTSTKNEMVSDPVIAPTPAGEVSLPLRPSFFEQLIRAFLHALQFFIAYLIML